jgi:hypothetical protein
LHADEHKLTEKWLILGARHEPAFVQTSGTSITTAAMSKARMLSLTPSTR